MAPSSKVPGGGERSPAFHVLAVTVGLLLLMLATPRLVRRNVHRTGHARATAAATHRGAGR